MSDLTPSTGGDTGSGAVSDDNGQMAMAIYILHLVGFVTAITPIVGVVLAYVAKDTAPEWLKSHYENAISIFWKGLLYLVISIILCVVVIGAFLLLAQVVWYIVRCVKGIVALNNRQPYPNPESWGF